MVAPPFSRSFTAFRQIKPFITLHSAPPPSLLAASMASIFPRLCTSCRTCSHLSASPSSFCIVSTMAKYPPSNSWCSCQAGPCPPIAKRKCTFPAICRVSQRLSDIPAAFTNQCVLCCVDRHKHFMLFDQLPTNADANRCMLLQQHRQDFQAPAQLPHVAGPSWQS